LASDEEIATLPGFGMQLAEQIKNFLADFPQGPAGDTPKD
jgi:DNA uptake protein ComE-like DNA-binding protein